MKTPKEFKSRLKNRFIPKNLSMNFEIPADSIASYFDSPHRPPVGLRKKLPSPIPAPPTRIVYVHEPQLPKSEPQFDFSVPYMNRNPTDLEVIKSKYNGRVCLIVFRTAKGGSTKMIGKLSIGLKEWNIKVGDSVFTIPIERLESVQLWNYL